MSYTIYMPTSTDMYIPHICTGKKAAPNFYKLMIPVLGRLRLDDQCFKATLDYIKSLRLA